MSRHVCDRPLTFGQHVTVGAIGIVIMWAVIWLLIWVGYEMFG